MLLSMLKSFTIFYLHFSFVSSNAKSPQKRFLQKNVTLTTLSNTEYFHCFYGYCVIPNFESKLLWKQCYAVRSCSGILILTGINDGYKKSHCTKYGTKY